MNIDAYKQPDGTFLYNECSYEDAESLIATGLLGWCGCGMPSKALAFVRDALRAIELTGNDCFLEPNENHWDERKSAESRLYPSDGAYYFAMYVLDSKGLTEHGSGVGGCWLTQSGKMLLSDLEELTTKEIP